MTQRTFTSRSARIVHLMAGAALAVTLVACGSSGDDGSEGSLGTSAAPSSALSDADGSDESSPAGDVTTEPADEGGVSAPANGPEAAAPSGEGSAAPDATGPEATGPETSAPDAGVPSDAVPSTPAQQTTRETSTQIPTAGGGDLAATCDAWNALDTLGRTVFDGGNDFDENRAGFAQLVPLVEALVVDAPDDIHAQAQAMLSSMGSLGDAMDQVDNTADLNALVKSDPKLTEAMHIFQSSANTVDAWAADNCG